MARPLFLQIEGFLRASPPIALRTLGDALGQAGGCLVGAHPLGNVALSVAFELEASHIPALQRALQEAGVELFAGSPAALEALVGRSGEVTGQLLVTLLHDHADDPAPIPSIPG